MKITGYAFVIFGSIWTIAGFASYASDIQLGIALGGINMIGIGIILVHLSKKSSSGTDQD